MAIFIGPEKGHYDVVRPGSPDVVRHQLMDAAARASIAPTEAASTASTAHAAGSYFIYSGTLYKATSAIAAGDTITPGTNCEAVSGGIGGEVSEIKSAITNLDETEIDYIVNASFPLGFRTGYFAANSGASNTTGSYSRTITYLPVNVGDKVRLPKSSTYRYSVVIFSSPTPSYANNISNSEIYIDGHYAEVGEDYVFTAKAGEYYFICCNIPYDNGPTAVPDKPTAISSMGQKFAEIEAAEDALDERIDDLSDELDEKIAAIGKTESLQTAQWVQGGLTTAMTYTTTNNHFARIQGAYLYKLPSDGALAISIPDDLEGRVAVYSQTAFSSLVATVSPGATIPAYVSGKVPIPIEYNGLYLGMDVRKVAGGDFTDGEIAALGTRITVIYTSAIGDMAALETDNKRTVVEAINEVENSIGGMDSRLPEGTLDWSRYATVTYPTGWRVGSWTDAGAHNTGAGNSIHLIEKLTKSDLAGTRKIKIEYGSYGQSTIVGTVRIFLRATPTELYDKIILSESGQEIEIDPNLDALYAINLAGFGTAGQAALDNDYPDSIVITKYMEAAPPVSKYARTRASDFFYVQVNSVYPTAGADADTPENVDCVLRLPGSYTPDGAPTRLIFMHHGNSGTVNVTAQTWYSESNVWVNFVNAYLNAGYAVFDVNGAGPVSDANASHDYASFKALSAAFKAYQYIKRRYNVHDRIFVHGSSMGGATACAFAKQFGGIVDAIGLFSPALLSRSAQMSSVYDFVAANFGYADYAEMVNDGYARLVPSTPQIDYYLDGAKVGKAYTYDWVNEHVTDGLAIVCKDFRAPIKIWCGTADTSVDPKYGEELAKAIVNGGGFALFRPVQDGVHSAGLGGDSTVNAEAVVWFNRFNG